MPDALHARLAAAAKRQRHILNNEAIVSLEAGLGAASPSVAQPQPWLLYIQGPRLGGNLIFQYVYGQSRDEQAFDNIQGPCLLLLAAAKALKPTSKQQLEHSE